VQVLACLAVFALKLAMHTRMVHMNYDPIWRLARSVNYPFWVVFLAIAYPINWLVSPPHPGEWLLVGEIAVGVLFLSGVALFWYLVVAEIEMRRQGKSLLRFPGWFKELLAASIMLLLGAGAFMCAYVNGRTLLPEPARLVDLFLAPARTCEFLSMLILTAWGIVLVGLALHDLIAFLRGREHGATAARSS
jgi:hypothetical protein